jgi:hypothetical protein
VRKDYRAATFEYYYSDYNNRKPIHTIISKSVINWNKWRNVGYLSHRMGYICGELPPIPEFSPVDKSILHLFDFV